jgi:modulator of FtsH protease
LLVSILLSSTLLLVPNQSDTWLGIELLAIGIVTWIAATILDVKRLRQLKTHNWRAEPVRLGLTQLSSIPYMIAGILLWLNSEQGLYWLVIAVVACYLKSLTDAWVLLVEINR